MPSAPRFLQELKKKSIKKPDNFGIILEFFNPKILYFQFPMLLKQTLKFVFNSIRTCCVGPKTVENIGIIISLVRRMSDFVPSMKHNFKVER